MTEAPTRPLSFGELLPGLSARSTTRQVGLPTLAGRERVLVFVATLGGPGDAGRLAVCRSLLSGRGADEPPLLFVSADPPDAPPDALRDPAVDGRVLLDGDGRVAGGFRVAPPVGDAAVVFLLDRSLRVVERRSVERLDRVAAVLDEWRARPALRRPDGLPPVLMLDKVFEDDFAAALIRRFEADGGTASGFMVRDGDLTRGRLDRRIKRRRDVVLDDPVMMDQCRKRIVLRLAPMIVAAFQFRATRIERYLIARYDSAERGEFRAHRDNDTSGTAHRRFAVTVNLNDDYEGGGLRFPEFGDAVYRPAAGSALVFSCSLLHEATQVTAGVRYAFLTFLFDDADAVTWRDNQKLVVV